LSESDFYTPADIDLLRMENELLAFEVRFLRARLSQPKVDRSPADRLSHLEEAEHDLQLLLKRMWKSPLGPLFRRTANFRVLEQRYLDSPVSYSSPQRQEYLEGAERDLQLLLKRMGSAPFGWLFRRRRSFRTLEERYL
jgi:hypothetical protein